MRVDDSDTFQPIHNPYIVGNPIKDRAMFFGREDDFTYIRQKVTGGKKGGLLVLCGGRRSGKTSVLFQVMNGRLGEEFFPVLIDMQAMTVENDLDFLIKLAQGIVDTIGDPDISLKKDFLSKKGQGSLLAFQDFVLKVNERLRGKKLILLFDEYEIFESHIAKKLISTEILNLLANWIEHKEGVFVVFTGSDKLEERTAEYWSHFLGKALHRRISFLSKSDTLRLITEPLKGVIRFEKGLPESIYSLTAGQPFYTQVLCQALIDHLNEVREYDLTPAKLQASVDQIIENPLPQMIFTWNSLGNLEKLVLSVIGELNRESVRPVGVKEILAFVKDEKTGYQIDSSALNETLEKLFHHDMLSKGVDHGTYSFKMDLWRRWVGRMHSIWQVVDEIKSGGGALGEGLAVVAKRRRRGLVLAVGAVAMFLATASIVYTNFIAPDRGDNETGVATRIRTDSTTVTIRTVPTRARVFLGREQIGWSPIEGRAVPVGETILRVELDGYKDSVATLELRKDEPVERSITLLEKTGHMRITSTPTGAVIHIDDRRTGTTPKTIKNLSINQRYDVKLTLSQYDPANWAGVRIYEDSTEWIHGDFVRSTSQVHITSDPRGARIKVDGDVIGDTPLYLALEYGRRRLVLDKDGYQPKDSTVTIPPPGNRISVVLNRLPKGTLVIKVVPFADIYIDDERMSEQAIRYEGTLYPGDYKVELRHHEFGVVRRDAKVTSNRTTKLNINMIEEGQKQ